MRYSPFRVPLPNRAAFAPYGVDRSPLSVQALPYLDPASFQLSFFLFNSIQFFLDLGAICPIIPSFLSLAVFSFSIYDQSPCSNLSCLPLCLAHMSNSTSDAMTGYSFYHYDANPEAILGVAAGFGLSAVVHLIMMISKRTFFYTPMTVGAFSQWISVSTSEICRTNSIVSDDCWIRFPLPFTQIPRQFNALYRPKSAHPPAPSLYAATMYMIYGRIVLFVNSTDASIIKPTRVTKIFVIGDVLSFIIQSAGGGMMAQQGTADLGQKVLLTGLGCQIVFFGFFLIIAITFKNRMSRSPTRHIIPVYEKHSWRKLLQLLLVASVFIVIRCAYRVAEYVMGDDGYLMDNEWCAYVGDTIPMLFVQVAFHFVHAGDVFPKAGEEMIEDKSYFNLEERV